jgi:hypothetical protein
MGERIAVTRRGFAVATRASLPGIGVGPKQLSERCEPRVGRRRIRYCLAQSHRDCAG